MSLYILKVSGNSDDLVQLEGVISDELGFYPDDDDKNEMFLGLGDGTCLSIRYTEDGVWRIAPVTVGSCTTLEKKDAVSADDDDYSDVVTLTSTVPFNWAVMSEEKVIA